MRRWNKVVAMFLAVIMVAAMLPLGVFAESWVKVEASAGEDAPVLTVTVDADKLTELIKSGELFTEASGGLLSMVELDVESLMNIFTPEEILEIIPQNVLLEYFDAAALAEDMDPAEIMNYIEDYVVLLEGCDLSELPGFLPENVDLSKIFVFSVLMNYVEFDDAYDYLREDEIKKLLNERLKADGVVEEFVEALKGENVSLSKVINFSKLLSDGVISLNSGAVSVDDIKNSGLIDFDDPDLATDLISAEVFDLVGLEAFMKTLPNAKSYFDSDKVLSLLDIKDYIGDFDYTDFDIDFNLFNEDHLNQEALVEEDYTVNYETGVITLTEIGKQKIAADPTKYLTEKGMEILEGQVSLEKDIYPLIDTEKLIEDVGIENLAKCLIVESAIRIEGINDYISYTKLIEFVGGIDAILANESIAIDYAALDLTGLQNVGDVNAYISFEVLSDSTIVPRKILVDAAGGEEKLLDCVDTTALFGNRELLNKVVAAITEDTSIALTDVVDVSAFINAVTDKAALVDFIGIDKIRKQIDNEELQQIIDSVEDVFAYVTDKEALIGVFVDELYWAVDLLTVDGTVVAKENPETATLGVDAEALVKTLRRLLPSLSEFAALEGNTLLTTILGLTYQGEGATEATEKSIALEIILAGDIDALKTSAGELDALIRKYFDLKIEEGGNISLGIHLPEITTPAALATVYKQLLDDESLSEETREKLLGLGDSEFSGFIESLTLEDATELLGAIDIDKLYSALISISFVQTVLEKLEGRTGVALGDLTLDEMKETLLTLPSAERLCEIVEEKTGRDVRAILDKAAERFDGLTENAAVEKMLNLVEEKLNCDLSDVSVSDILDRNSDVGLSDKVAQIVAEKIGRDVFEVLESHTAEELYDLAVEKATANKSRFEKVRNYVIKTMDYLPDELADLRISDWYRGNGDFGGEFSFDLKYKSAIEKVARKAITAIKPDMSEGAVNALLNRIPDGTLSCTVDVSNVHVTDVYQITYKDRADDEILLRAYLPVGADLTVFKNKSADWLGYEFTGWAYEDEDGKVFEISEMPAKDITVYADLAAVEVKFYDTEEKFLAQIIVPTGKKIDRELAAQIEALVEREMDDLLHENVHILWETKDKSMTGVDLETATFTKDVSLYAYLENDYHLEIEDENDEYEFEVSYTDGTMSLVIQNKTFEEVAEASFRLSREKVLQQLLEDDSFETLKIAFKDGDSDDEKINVFELDETMIRQIVGATAPGDELFLEYRRLTTEEVDELENPMYRGLENAIFYDFNINVLHAGATERTLLNLGNFNGSLIVRLPFAAAIPNPVDGEKTVVHILSADARERVEAIVSSGLVQFNAPHFSEFVVANEYTVTSKFLFADTLEPANGSLEDLDETYPVGAIVPLNPVFDALYEVDRIEISAGTLSEDQKSFTMPEEAVVITVYLRQAEANVLYFVNGKLYQTVSYRDKLDFVPLDINTVVEDASVTAPKGYTKVGAEWVGFDATKLGIEDIYVFAQWNPIEYTVNFVSEETNTTVSYTFTIENYESILPPAVPTVAGMKGSWESYDLSKLFDGTETALTVKALYTPVTYSVIVRYENGANDAVLQAIPGTEVSIPQILMDHCTAKVTAVDSEGNELSVEDWTLTMPAATVYVTVAYEAETVPYVVNAIRYFGRYNETVVLLIPLEADETVTSISDNCVYVGREDKADGTVVLKYQFVLTSADCVIEYKVKKINEPTENVFNGALHTDSKAPVSQQGNVDFAGWAAGVGGLNFATFRQNGQISLLWLWILLPILLLIALIALIYLLYKSGSMKRNVLTCVVEAIVSLFFKLCLGVCAAVLAVLGLFGIGKKTSGCASVPMEEAVTEEELDDEADEEKTLTQSKKRKGSKKKKKNGTKQGRKWKQNGKRKKNRRRKATKH